MEKWYTEASNVSHACGHGWVEVRKPQNLKALKLKKNKN